MIKIPKVYMHAVKVVEAIQCTCQRCEPPHVWIAENILYDDHGQLQPPKICPRCKSKVWWKPYTNPKIRDFMRQRHAKEMPDKSSSPP
jgi:hypothetical protein